MKARLSSLLAGAAMLATTILPAAVNAADTEAISPGDLIKCASTQAVYYFGNDGKRYVFPNEKTYFTWYTDFKTVKTISDKRCSTLPLGRSNVTYRPGVKMIKITTDPRTYAVEKGGILRHVSSQQMAETLFGLNWKNKIDDVADAFFSNYKIGDPITDASQYNAETVKTATVTISQDKSFDDMIATVAIGDSSAGFVPFTMTVKKGVKVTWVNRDITDHSIAGEGNINSGNIAPDATYSVTFNTIGSYTYHDGNSASVTGVINVVQ
jgi:plastocyanin